MAWLTYRLRAMLRLRRWSLIALAVFVALVGGTVLAAAAGARRAATAVDRLEAASLDPNTFLDTRGSDPAKLPGIAELPSVAAAAPIAFAYAFPPGEGYFPFLASTDGQAGSKVARGVLVAGRRARPGAAEELVLSEATTKRLHVHAGQTMELTTYTSEGARRFDESGGNGQGDGPRVRMRVVGVIRGTLDLAVRAKDPTINILPQAFYERYRDRVNMVEGSYLVRFRDGAAGAGRFSRELRELYAGGPAPGIDAGTNSAQFLRQSTNVQAVGLAAFGAVFLLFGLGAIAQAMTRAVNAGRSDHSALAGMGMTGSGRALDAAMPAALAATAGCVSAVVIAVAVSPLLPIGLARRADPNPGLHTDLLVLLGGGAVLLVAALAVIAWPAWRLGRQSVVAEAPLPASPRPSIAGRLVRAGRPSLAVGIDMATRRGRGTTEVAVRTALLGVLIGVTGLAATVVFSGSLQRLLDTPARYGWSWDVATTADVDSVIHRPDVAAVADGVFSSTAQIAGRAVYVSGIEMKKGSIAAPASAGRGPLTAGEAALGADLRRRFGRTGRVRIVAGDKTATFRVVGTALSATVEDPVAMDGGVLLTPEGLERLGLRKVEVESSAFHQTLIRFRPGVDVHNAARTIVPPDVNDQTISFAKPGPEVAKLDQVRGLPRLLGFFLGGLAFLALLHALVQTVQRRRTELGVLRAIGFTRGQVAGTIGWQAVALAVVGAGAGLPAGVALGRWVWTVVANGLGVAPRPEVALLLLLVVPATAAVAGLVGVALGRFAGHAPAAALRTE